jgi:transposase-like protein
MQLAQTRNIDKLYCPKCGSKKLIKKGTRKNKLKTVFLWQCNECLSKFTDDNFKNKSYPVSKIIKAITFHNKGFTIKECAEKTDVPASTISNWISDYKEMFGLSNFSRIINKFKQNSKIVETKKYDHGVIYLYQHNKFKLETFVKPVFKGLYEYLNLVKDGKIDKAAFIESNGRASQAKLNIGEISLVANVNINCKMAKMALEIAKDNRSRHWAVEKTMIDNDLYTVATEVPVYIYINKTNMPYLKSLAAQSGYISGHIDILQVKDNYIYILDYKPDAAKEKPLGQLFVYACCLSRLTGIHFAKIKLAWFDDKDYFETDTMDVYKNVKKTFK